MNNRFNETFAITGIKITFEIINFIIQVLLFLEYGESYIVTV
jgi:hypothetical protein